MSLAIYLLGVFTVVLVMLSSHYLGEKGRGLGKTFPYESGVKAFGTTRVRFHSHYFMAVVLFVIFDLESVFLYVWASSVRETSWIGFVQIFFFALMLLLALGYSVSMGAIKSYKSALLSNEKVQ